jgi:hypothetical protein
MAIAAEDIGIADLDLLLEVTRLATDKGLRSVLASDAELIEEVSAKLAAAPKERSADYLHSAATWKISAEPRHDLFANDFQRQVVERDAEEIVAQAARLLLHCTTTARARYVVDETALRNLFKDGTYAPNATMEELIERFALVGAHPFTLMLLPLWSALSKGSLESRIVTQPVPPAEYIRGVPLHAFDKHTAVGKSAISRFARENPKMRNALARWVAPSRQLEVALMAAFYTDAMPVSRKLQWERSDALEELGCRADMLTAGCSVRGMSAILACTRSNLDDLNIQRRRLCLGH